MYTQGYEFEWDENKNKFNLQKHGISFQEAILIFRGPVLSLKDERYEYGEVRFITLGEIKEVAVIVTINTKRNKKIRIISARKANKKERKLYYEHLKKKN